jgi:hypothetical protein
MRVAKPEAREWYMNEAAEQNWSTRALLIVFRSGCAFDSAC